MEAAQIPESPEAITPPWLTRALRNRSTISEAVVESVEMNLLGEGQGFAGQIARVKLNYDIEEKGAPRSLIAKFPSADPTARSLIRQYRVCEREIRFYEEIANRVGVATPSCYGSVLDRASGDGVLLLEDLTDARVGDNVAGCSRDEAELALRQLAKLHAGWWGSRELEDLDWMPYFNDNAEMVRVLYEQTLWDTFLQKVEEIFPGRQLPVSLLDIGAGLRNNLAQVANRLAESPRTLVHGDYRLDNLLFGTAEYQVPLTIIDWQGAVRGRGAADLWHFMIYCLPPEQRRAMEQPLLDAYHTALREHGVRDYDFSQCLYDYRFAGFHQVAMMVLGVGILGVLSTEGGRDRFEVSLERCVAAIEDHDLASLMPE
jgi:aminoglycoside/choline kinase family phosphotransferase